MLPNSKQRALNKLEKQFENRSLTWTHLESTPPWLHQKVVNDKIVDASNDAFVEVRVKAVPVNANDISSHIIFKLETKENGTKQLKAWHFPHENRGYEKGSICSDSANVQFDKIRLLFSLAT